MPKPIEYDPNIDDNIHMMRLAVGERNPMLESAVCRMWMHKKNSHWRIGIADDVEICELALSHECLRRRLLEAEQKIANFESIARDIVND